MKVIYRKFSLMLKCRISLYRFHIICYLSFSFPKSSLFNSFLISAKSCCLLGRYNLYCLRKLFCYFRAKPFLPFRYFCLHRAKSLFRVLVRKFFITVIVIYIHLQLSQIFMSNLICFFVNNYKAAQKPMKLYIASLSSS